MRGLLKTMTENTKWKLVRSGAWGLGLFFLVFFGFVFSGCKRSASSSDSATLVIGAYSIPREVYGKSILPAFREQWKRKTGRDVEFHESYLASGAQARAIAGGFDADIAVLSLDPDIGTIQKSGLIKHDWKAGEYGGMVTHSIVVIGVRKGNPKNIKSWRDLTRPDVEVLIPHVRTSGGAMWNVLAVYGAALRGSDGVKKDNVEEATEFLAGVLRNVKIMDRSGRESMLTFERGIGDAIITYENEILVTRLENKHYDYITPASTLLIENPVALIDEYVKKHSSRDVAQAFLEFLWTPESQRAYAQYGLRPVVPSIAAEVADRFAPVEDLFTVRDLGGWPEVQRVILGEGGIYDKALEKSRQRPPI